MAVRDAVPDDVPEITAMVLEHADHEGGLDRCHLDEVGAAAALFGTRAVLRAVVAVPDGSPEVRAGCALWYPTFSSWAGTHGIWLEDLYVRPAFRGIGLGREMLLELRRRTTGRLEWDVHVGNGEARGFYGKLGARPVTEWTKFRWEL